MTRVGSQSSPYLTTTFNQLDMIAGDPIHASDSAPHNQGRSPASVPRLSSPAIVPQEPSCTEKKRSRRDSAGSTQTHLSTGTVPRSGSLQYEDLVARLCCMTRVGSQSSPLTTAFSQLDTIEGDPIHASDSAPRNPGRPPASVPLLSWPSIVLRRSSGSERRRSRRGSAHSIQTRVSTGTVPRSGSAQYKDLVATERWPPR